MSQFFASDGQSIGASALASVLPMNVQGQFLLGLTGLISLQSKVLSRVFSNTTVQKQLYREALDSQQKEDRELTVAQIMNSLLPNSDFINLNFALQNIP